MYLFTWAEISLEALLSRSWGAKYPTSKHMFRMYSETHFQLPGAVRERFVRDLVVAGVSPKLPLDFWPKFLQDIGGHVDADLHAELRNGVASGPIVRVVRS
jgi:hypothetical protein